MRSPSQPLRIAIIGAGNIGSAFAFQLSRVGHHEVSVIARPGSDRLQQLRRDGAVVNIAGERAHVQVADALDEQIAYDLVIVTLMAHQVDAILPALRRSQASCIQFMFNIFDPERLQHAIGAQRCTFGMPFVQSLVGSRGRLKATIGAGGQRTIMDRQCWVDLFNASGLPAACEPDMPLWLRCHAPLCVAFESVSVAGQRRGGGASWSEAMVLARGVRASFGLIRGLGYAPYPASKRRIAATPAMIIAAVLWSMSRVRSFRELLATGKVECGALVDVMLAAAPGANPPADVRAIAAMRPSS